MADWEVWDEGFGAGLHPSAFPWTTISPCVQVHRIDVDGEQLHVEHTAPTGTLAGGVVLVHGFNACAQEFGPLAGRLAADGFHVAAYDQRGFGASEGEPGFLDAPRFHADLDAVTDWLQERVDCPLFVVGHSFGAAMALDRLCRLHPFRGAVLAHPVKSLWAAVPAWKRPLFGAAARFNRRRPRRSGENRTVGRRNDYSHLFEDQRLARAAYAEARFVADRVNLGVYDLVQSMDPVGWAGEVDLPALAVLGPHDGLIPYEDSLEVVRSLAGPVQTMQHRGGHACFRDLDGDAVGDAIAAWLQEQVA